MQINKLAVSNKAMQVGKKTPKKRIKRAEQLLLSIM